MIILQEQEHTFSWEEINSWDADEEGMNFTFEFQRTGKKPRQVRVMSPYVSKPFSYNYFVSGMQSLTLLLHSDLFWTLYQRNA